MTEKNKPAISMIAAVVFVAAIIISSPFCNAQVQDETAFGASDSFSIPEQNNTIRFSVDGTYEQARFENGSWTFLNLYLSNSPQPRKLNFTASAENSDVTITLLRAYTTTFDRINLRYNVTSPGKQTFNFGNVPELGEWSVTFNGNYVGENEGWTLSPDSTVVVTGATANVTISYYTLPDSFGKPSDTNVHFYQQHSVAIATGAGLVITVGITAGIWRRNRTKKGTE